MATEAEVLTALSQIIDPDFGKDIVTLGFVKELRIDGSHAAFTIELTTPACPVKEEFRRQAEEVVGRLPGITRVSVNMTARVAAGASARQAIPGIANIIAVASGKGGVGKSTTAVNLAVAMAQTGARVGLLDADIYGPSVPRMMGLSRFRPEIDVDGKIIYPLENFGVKTMSIGYLVEENKAMIWRGPMVAGALGQLLGDVAWGELDYLFVDMPPGTGDAQLTLTQKVPVTGAIMVTTPQDIALIDCRKGMEMFRQVHVPTLGMVENMSQFICPHCGEASHIFSEGGAARLGEEYQTSVLAQIPLDIRIRELSDAGTPIVAAHPDSAQAAAYCQLAGEVARKISILNNRRIDIPVVMQS
ncbi:iron-sulfur cluster carrier protein ApbC [Mariprofundus erugo]|uniref:Iron-sulfur cluster carrier protein n=1 Tax=Mariprofundus erugo TaxID=2528639 RepID=A0A5R9GIM4_9PROT|nr:iron-sulfur cluster carrier protein ApbC [Mariprofundus erugo]TLS66551.1 iron-sulfur cluster carrier protein ApbC [Mariprofundus erugo]TLS77819.1 iron-sulfur cluster carrier protein ApbC [Mariprofundus erugo]